MGRFLGLGKLDRLIPGRGTSSAAFRTLASLQGPSRLFSNSLRPSPAFRRIPLINPLIPLEKKATPLSARLGVGHLRRCRRLLRRIEHCACTLQTWGLFLNDVFSKQICTRCNYSHLRMYVCIYIYIYIYIHTYETVWLSVVSLDRKLVVGPCSGVDVFYFLKQRPR